MMLNMWHRSDSVAPPQNLDSAINRVLKQMDAEEGVPLFDLPVGAVLEVETGQHVYRVENRGEGKIMISGHPEICPEPVLADLLGSSQGGPLLRMRFIGRGMRMEFVHPTRGVIKTSRVRDIRKPGSKPS